MNSVIRTEKMENFISARMKITQNQHIRKIFFNFKEHFLNVLNVLFQFYYKLLICK